MISKPEDAVPNRCEGDGGLNRHLEYFTVKEVGEAIQELHNIKASLRGKACSFMETGNELMGDYLFDTANSLARQALVLDNWLKLSFDDLIKNTEQSSLNTVKAALAGAKVEREESQSRIG